MTQARLALGQIDQARAFIGDLEKYHPNYLKTKLLKIQASFSANEPENRFAPIANELLEDVRKRVSECRQTMRKNLEELAHSRFDGTRFGEFATRKICRSASDLTGNRSPISPSSSAAMVNLAKVAVAERNYRRSSESLRKSAGSRQQKFRCFERFGQCFDPAETIRPRTSEN